jgi:hypothetical protein
MPECLYPSLGRQLLSLVVTRPNLLPNSVLGTLIGTSSSRISHWIAGDERPRKDFRERLAAIIPIEAWEDRHERTDEQLELEYHALGVENRVLPHANWDRSLPSRALEDAPEPTLPPLPEGRGIADVQWAIDATRQLLEREQDPAQEAKLIAAIATLGEKFAKLQREAPLEDNAPQIDYSRLDYTTLALLQAADRLRAWLIAHPGEAPPVVPRVPLRMAVVDGLRGAALGVVTPDGWVTLVAPTGLDAHALKGLVQAGWAPPVRPRGHYEHEDEAQISVAPKGGGC